MSVNRRTAQAKPASSRACATRLWNRDMVYAFIKEFHIAMRAADTNAAPTRKTHKKRLNEASRP
ncbi:hypothetical protein [Roseinatronobacter sp.]